MTPRHWTARRLFHLLAVSILAIASPGCAPFWDEVFSRERDMHAYFNPPSPLVVIKDSTDGERRAQALASLREPLQKAGTQKDQDTYVEILTTAARNDADPFCRLGAIQALGYFKDQRASKALVETYARIDAAKPFTPDFNGMIRLTALRSLAKIGDEEALRWMMVVAAQPPPRFDAASADRQQTQDEKLTCIRALGKYHQAEAMETLVHVLESKERSDIALRDAAHESLKLATGKNLPAEPDVWRAALAGQPVQEEQPSIIQRVSAWLK